MRRRTPSRSDPKKLAQKRGTVLSHAGVVSKLSQKFAEPAEYTGFWLCDPQEKRIGMALEIRRSTNVPSSGGSKKPTPSPAA
jgi:hypothetical protein